MIISNSHNIYQKEGKSNHSSWFDLCNKFTCFFLYQLLIFVPFLKEKKKREMRKKKKPDLSGIKNIISL
jgi:hypothetical protein